MTQYQIYIGCNDRQTKSEVVSEKELAEMVSSFFEKREIAFSLSFVLGGYVGKEKTLIRENTVLITIIGEQDLDIVKLSKALSMYMNQECLMITKTEKDVKYE